MKNILSNLSLNKKLAIIALGLGFIGLFLGNPYKGSKFSVDAKEMSLIVDKQVDHVTVEDLADMIIQGKSDYRLIDLRTEKEFQEYNIPSSENIPLPELEKSEFGKTEKIILYSEGGIHSAQAWFILKAKEYKGVYILLGGLDDWKDKVLFPKMPENANAEQLAGFEKRKEISKFFGGVPQTSVPQTGVPQTGVTTDTKETPKIQAPKLENPGGVKPPAGEPKKKKEGC